MDYSQEVLDRTLITELAFKPAVCGKFGIPTQLKSLDLSENDYKKEGEKILQSVMDNVFLNNISNKLAARIIADNTLPYCLTSLSLSDWLRREGLN